VDTDSLFVLGGFLISLALLWIFVLGIRPSVARARLRGDATAVRDRIVDAMLDGDIKPDDKAALDALQFCHLMTDHVQAYGATEALAVHRTFLRLGVSVDDFPKMRDPNVTYGDMTPQGRKVMNEASGELNAIVARYFVQGSLLWWFLSPVQWVWRRPFAQRLRRRVFRSPTPDATSPHLMAREVRRVSREATPDGAAWRSTFTDAMESLAKAHPRDLQTR